MFLVSPYLLHNPLVNCKWCHQELKYITGTAVFVSYSLFAVEFNFRLGSKNGTFRGLLTYDVICFTRAVNSILCLCSTWNIHGLAMFCQKVHASDMTSMRLFFCERLVYEKYCFLSCEALWSDINSLPFRRYLSIFTIVSYWSSIVE
jgi:hypothetical protein